MKTEPIYYKDPYLARFEATIQDIVELGEGQTSIILDRTCFFPRGGGAQGDGGNIGSAIVGEAFVDRETGSIHHPVMATDAAALSLNSVVACAIDWPQRYNTMLLHSASHIMEHFLLELLPELTLVGTNVNENRDSSTYTGVEVTPEDIDRLNAMANQFISDNHPIETYPDDCKPGFRYWRCGQIVIPCGGVHPRNTSEIGTIKVIKKRGGKKQEIRTELRRM